MDGGGGGHHDDGQDKDVNPGPRFCRVANCRGASHGHYESDWSVYV